MSLDNSVAIAGVADGNIPIVIFGVLLSIPIIIWGSSLILKYLDKFPSIVFLGALLLGWIGGDMIQTDVSVTDFTSTFDLFVIPLLFAILTVFLPNIRRKL